MKNKEKWNKKKKKITRKMTTTTTKMNAEEDENMIERLRETVKNREREKKETRNKK